MAADGHVVSEENTETPKKPKSDKIRVVYRSGSSLVKLKPLFSSDSKYLLLCCGDVVKVYSVLSGDCFQQLEGHSGLVTSLLLNPQNCLQLYTASLDQTLLLWDYIDGVLLKTFVLHYPVFSLMSFPSSNTILGVRQVSKSKNELVKIDLPHQGQKKVDTEVILSSAPKDQEMVALGYKGAFVAIVNRKTLTVYDLKKQRTIEHNLDREGLFTCVACHPTEYCIATGISDGKILLWWGFLGAQKVIKSVCHWHALSVNCLTFTAEGSYMLSGGHECVLVKWQHNSSHRDFLPRLGAPINHIACSHDNTAYAVCNVDNVLQVVSSNMKVVQVIQGLTQGHLAMQLQNPTPVGLLVDPRTGCLVTNGKPGHLQFYSLANDKQLYNLDIVGQNYISPENLKQPTVVTEIEKAVFDDQGLWLATVERRDDLKTSQEMHLKFWLYNTEMKTYVLNTDVDLPHRKCVSAVRFRSVSNDSTPMLVSTSQDGGFKLWTVVDDSDIYRNHSAWNCDSVGLYRDFPAGDADFSEDGSLLAVAFHATLTLWDPDTNALRVALPGGGQQHQHIKSVLFGRRTCSHLLVCTRDDCLVVWNLLRCTVQFTVDVSIVAIVADPLTDIMAAVTKSSDVYIFSPNNPSPIHVEKQVCKLPIVTAMFVPRDTNQSIPDVQLPWQQKSQLYMMDKSQGLLTLISEEEFQRRRSKNTLNLSSVAQNLPVTPFSLLMSKSLNNRQDVHLERKEGGLGIPGVGVIKEMLSTPVHVLPPVSSLCNSFLTAMLRTGNNFKSKASEDSDDSDDEKPNTADESSSDSDMDTSSSLQADQNKINIQDEANQTSGHWWKRELPQKNKHLKKLLTQASSQDFSWLSDQLSTDTTSVIK